MNLTVKNQLTSNLTLKIISLMLGYGLWLLLSQSRTAELWADVPVCFYNVPAQIQINAPETISVQLVGHRSDLYALDNENLAFHIDGELLHVGENLLPVSREALFLPHCIKLVNYAPIPTIITVQHKEIS